MRFGILDDEQWCPAHLCWESPEEWMACDDELHNLGFRNVGGVPMQVESPDFELTI